MTKKGHINELLELKLELKLKIREDIKYNIETIKNSVVYATETVGQLPKFYYLLS